MWHTAGGRWKVMLTWADSQLISNWTRGVQIRCAFSKLVVAIYQPVKTVHLREVMKTSSTSSKAIQVSSFLKLRQRMCHYGCVLKATIFPKLGEDKKKLASHLKRA